MFSQQKLLPHPLGKFFLKVNVDLEAWDIPASPVKLSVLRDR